MVSKEPAGRRSFLKDKFMKRIIRFIKESIQELGKVTWPTRSTVLRLTLGVMVVSVLFAIFIGLVDLGLTNGLRGLVTFIEQRKGTSQSTGSSPIQINPEDIQVNTQPTQ